METEHAQQPREENGGPVLEIRDLTKRFGATLALNSVSLTLGRNEVLALLGDNGAGKSTLIKCLSGVHEPDEGQIFIDGEVVHITSPMQARSLGVETVYQDLALFDNLDVVGNFYAGREPTTPGWLGNWGWVKDKDMAREADELMSRLEINLPGADVETGLMSGGQRQCDGLRTKDRDPRRADLSPGRPRIAQRAASDPGRTKPRGLRDRDLPQPRTRHAGG